MNTSVAQMRKKHTLTKDSRWLNISPWKNTKCLCASSRNCAEMASWNPIPHWCFFFLILDFEKSLFLSLCLAILSVSLYYFVDCFQIKQSVAFEKVMFIYRDDLCVDVVMNIALMDTNLIFSCFVFLSFLRTVFFS